MNAIHKYARDLCQKAFDIAEDMDLNVSVVATDRGGHVIVALRGDRASFTTLEAARRKCVAAACMQMSTATIADMISQDALVQVALHSSGDMLVVPGGFPIIFGEGCIGGIGIAGGHYKEDHIVGEKAFAALVGSSATQRKE